MSERVNNIAKQWKGFSETEAFKELMNYIDMQDEFAIAGAKGPVTPFGGDGGADLIFDPEKAIYLLQRSVMCDILRTYINGYVDVENQSQK